MPWTPPAIRFSSIDNGTGPFKLESLKQGEELIYVRNDDYWQGPAKLERVIDKAVPEAGTRFAMIADRRCRCRYRPGCRPRPDG